MIKNEFARRNTGILVLMAVLIAIPAAAQQNLMRILSPSAGTVVRPGANNYDIRFGRSIGRKTCVDRATAVGSGRDLFGGNG